MKQPKRWQVYEVKPGHSCEEFDFVGGKKIKIAEVHDDLFYYEILNEDGECVGSCNSSFGCIGVDDLVDKQA